MSIDDKDATIRAQLSADGPYEIRHGDVWLKGETIHIADGTQRLAVAFDEDGVLVKHGEASRVSAYVRKFDDAMRSMGDDAPVVTVVDFPVTPESVEELNACAATTGRVLRIVERLAVLGEGHVAEIPVPR